MTRGNRLGTGRLGIDRLEIGLRGIGKLAFREVVYFVCAPKKYVPLW